MYLGMQPFFQVLMPMELWVQVHRVFGKVSSGVGLVDINGTELDGVLVQDLSI